MPGFKIPASIINCPEDDPVGPLTGPSNTVETARSHRFLLEVLEPLGDQDGGMLLFLEKCTRPSPEFDKIMIHSAQDEIPRPGKIHWKEVEFTFYEKLQGQDNGQLEDQCAKLLYEWWSSSMFNIETSLFRPLSQYLKNCQLQMLDGNGEPVWTYFLYDCWPVRTTPSELSYSESGIATISVTLAYARAKERRK